LAVLLIISVVCTRFIVSFRSERMLY
jgi:hypothetical protein